MFQKANEVSSRYKITLLAFITVVVIKLSLRLAEIDHFLAITNVVLYFILFLLVCFGLWDLGRKRKEKHT
jgi:high-affinity Fe2+/Pb2+ permease